MMKSLAIIKELVDAIKDYLDEFKFTLSAALT